MDFSGQPHTENVVFLGYNETTCGAPELTSGRGLKKALRKANIPVDCWFQLAQDRAPWNHAISRFN